MSKIDRLSKTQVLDLLREIANRIENISQVLADQPDATGILKAFRVQTDAIVREFRDHIKAA